MNISAKNYLIAIVTGVAIFGFLYTLQSSLVGNVSSASTDLYVAAPVQSTAETRGYALPARLEIPSIKVNAKVQHVGLTASGAMGIPTNFTDVAWYKNGTIPGEVGNAAIDGHVDNALGLKGVFKYLKDAKSGDDVYITDKEGKRIHFEVVDMATYPYNATPTEEIFGQTDRTLLRLITCGGKWIQSAKTYDTRVVVTAEYVGE
jgi:sortase (surface protein transpeptidase)